MLFQTDQEFAAAMEKAYSGNYPDPPGLRNYAGRNPNEVIQTHGQKPAGLHFYYMKFRQDASFVWWQRSALFKPDEIDDTLIERKFSEWASEAQSETSKDAAKALSDPADTEWNGPCVMGFLMDNDTWECARTDDGKKPNAIHFANGSQTTTNAQGQPATRIFHENHTFGGSRIIQVDVNGTRRDVLTCINYYLAPDGRGPRPPGHVDTHYKFDIYYRVGLADSKGRRFTMIIDPSGKNTGP